MNLFAAVFAHDSSAPAINYQRRELTYGELRARTLRMAQALTSLGAARGDRVVLLLNDSPEFIEAFIAICSLGAIAVPINMALRIEEQCSILHNCGARFALAEDDICNTLPTDVRIVPLSSVFEKAGDTPPPQFPLPTSTIRHSFFTPPAAPPNRKAPSTGRPISSTRTKPTAAKCCASRKTTACFRRHDCRLLTDSATASRFHY